MTVKDLIKSLEKIPLSAEVVAISKTGFIYAPVISVNFEWCSKVWINFCGISYDGISVDKLIKELQQTAKEEILMMKSKEPFAHNLLEIDYQDEKNELFLIFDSESIFKEEYRKAFEDES